MLVRKKTGFTFSTELSCLRHKLKVAFPLANF